MEQGIKVKIGESAAEVFSTMYFMPVQVLEDIPSEENWNLDTRYISAKISFTGPMNAAVCFFFPSIMAKNIAERFLGIDAADISEQQALDTMKEAANMVIGSFLGKVDPEGVCKLGIPIAEFISEFSPVGSDSDAELLALISEFGYLWITYSG